MPHMVARPKRKRAEVSYVEPLDSFEAVVDGDDKVLSEDEFARQKKTTSKKRKRSGPSPNKARTDKTTFNFLDLPPELRDCIYEYALLDGRPRTICSRFKGLRRSVHRKNLDKHLVPALLAVNKQIHSEAIGCFYRLPLLFEDTLALFIFLATIGPRNRKFVADVTLTGWGSGTVSKSKNPAALTMLADCTNLTRLFFDCDLGERAPKMVGQRLYRDGHFFFEALGMARGRADAGVDVVQFGESTMERFRPFAMAHDGVYDEAEVKRKAAEKRRSDGQEALGELSRLLLGRGRGAVADHEEREASGEA